jgi:redox-sensitive bicupin YhaK (pirin superfamily)
MVQRQAAAVRMILFANAGRKTQATAHQGDPIVSYGPFVGDSKQDIVRLCTEFQSGQFVSLSDLLKADV